MVAVNPQQARLSRRGWASLQCLALGFALTVFLLPSLASGARPDFPSLSQKQEEKLAAGKLVLVAASSGEAGRMVTGVIQIDAEHQKIWSILLNNQNIVDSSKAIREVKTYKDVTTSGVRDLRLAFLLKVGWSEIRYHTARSYHVASQYMTWVLDKKKTNDIAWTEGSYSTWPGRKPGSTLFLYKARIDTGRAVPEWLEEDLTESSLKRYLLYVQKLAEG